jgi:hypothetical protein
MLTSIDGVGDNVSIRTFYVGALSPWRLPFYQYNSTTTWSSGVAFVNATFLAAVAQSFTKYQVHGDLKLHYRPLTASIATDNYILAVTADPAHPVVGLQENPTVNFPTTATLNNGPASVQFVAWAPWSASFPVDNTPKHMYCFPQFATGTSTITYQEEDLRTTCFGSICALAAQDNSSSLITTAGELYWEYTVDFMDPFPITDTSWVGADERTKSREIEVSRGPRFSLRDPYPRPARDPSWRTVHLAPGARAPTVVERKDGEGKEEVKEDGRAFVPPPVGSVLKVTTDDDGWAESSPPPGWRPAPSGAPGGTLPSSKRARP